MKLRHSPRFMVQLGNIASNYFLPPLFFPFSLAASIRIKCLLQAGSQRQDEPRRGGLAYAKTHMVGSPSYSRQSSRKQFKNFGGPFGSKGIFFLPGFKSRIRKITSFRVYNFFRIHDDLFHPPTVSLRRLGGGSFSAIHTRDRTRISARASVNWGANEVWMAGSRPTEDNTECKRF